LKYLKTFEIFSPIPMWIASDMFDSDESDEEIDNMDKHCRKCDGHYRKTQMTKATGELECDNCGNKIDRYEK